MTDGIQYYMRFRGRVTGPFPIEDLQRMSATGRLTRMHELSADNATWRRATQFDGLFVVPPPKAAASPHETVGEDLTPGTVLPSQTEQLRDTSSERQWHYEVDGSPAGPVPESFLRLMVRNQQIRGDARVWTEGMQDWIAVNKSELRDNENPPNRENSQPRRKFRIVGTDRDSGEEIELRIEAPSLAAAEELASRRGIIVAEIMATGAGTATVASPHVAGPRASTAGGLSPQRISIMVAAGVGMIATFLPWITIPIVGTVSGTAGDGWITFILFGIGLALSFVHLQRGRLTGGWLALAIAPSLLAGAVGVFDIVNVHRRMAEARIDGNPFSELFAGATQIGVGLYLVVIASLAVLILSFAVRR